MNTANKSEETNQNPAGGFLIAHFKRYPLATRPDNGAAG